MLDQSEAPVQETSEQTALQEQLQYHAAMAFGEQPPATAPSTIQETSESPNQEGASVENPQPTIQPTEEVVDPAVWLKSELGVDSVDAVKAALQELNQLREKANTPAEIAYANEEAKKWHTYIKEGKEDELLNSLQGRKMVKNLETMSDEQKLKLYIRMQNPRFDDELVQDEYDSLYKLNEEKFRNELDEVDQLRLRKEKLRMEQRIENDVAKASEYFSQYKTKIELPDLPSSKQDIDQDYLDYKASIAQSRQDYGNVIVPSVSSLKETDVQFTIKVDDPNSQMQFDVSITPDVNDFNTAKKESLDLFGYITKTYYDDKGNFNAAKLNRAILLEKNFDKYAQSIARQAVNAERKRVVSKETGEGGLVRNFNVNPQQMTELQKEAERAFAV